MRVTNGHPDQGAIINMTSNSKSLKNTYYAFRHGQSRANVEGIIVSDPAVGTVDYGLTEDGCRQVKDTLSEVRGFNSDTVLISSDFKRAVETAEIIRSELGVKAVDFDGRLRERFFGALDGKEHGNYSKAWKLDADNSDSVAMGVESSQAVSDRMWAVIESLEALYSNRTILLVSHGDPIMILTARFLGYKAGEHRSLAYIETAGMRHLNP